MSAASSGTAGVRLLFCGRTGSGKTSLACAMAGRELAWIRREGSAAVQASWESGGLGFTALEMPGFGLDLPGEARRLEAPARALADADVLVLCAPAPEEAWLPEAGWLRGVLEAAPGFPAIVCGTRIDLLSPRNWPPQAPGPDASAGHAALAWAARLQEALASGAPAFRKERFCLTSAGQTPGSGGSFGMEELRGLAAECLPGALQSRARLALALDRDQIRPKAEKIIWTAAVSAAAASLAPVPVADAAMVATVQAGMIVSVASLYGCVLSRRTALSLLAPAAGALGVRLALGSALKLLPGLGHAASAAVGAAVAGPMTLAAGYAFLDFFARREFSPSPEEIRQAFAEKFREAKARQGELAGLARKQAGRAEQAGGQGRR